MKGKNWKRISAIVVAASLMAAGCGTAAEEAESAAVENTAANENVQEAESQSVAEEPAAEEPSWTNDDSAEISIMDVSSTTTDEENMVLDTIMEKTNTKVKWIKVADGDYQTKLNALAAADDLPDIFVVKSLTEAQKYIDAGMVADLGAIIEAKAPNIKDQVGDILADVPVNKDGSVYVIPSGVKDYGKNLNLRKDWLENLGLEEPTDLESFKEVLTAFTYDDPDGNGQDDTYGYTFQMGNNAFNFANVYGAYGIPVDSEIELEDGTITTWVKHPRFMEAMTYIRELIDSGVVVPDFATISGSGNMEYLWTGRVGAMDFQCVGPTNNWMPGRYTEDPAPVFCFPTLTGPYGDSGVAATYPKLDQGYMISADCENLEGAIRLADYLISEEGDILTYLGVEGTMFQWIDKDAAEYEYLGDYTDSAIHRAHGGYAYWKTFQRTDNIELKTLNEQTREGVQQAWDQGIDWAYIPYVLDSYNDYGADMDQAVNEMLAELYTTTGDLNAVYEKWIAEWEMLGGSEWEKEATEMWKELNK